jgi:hypothetical protein
MRRFLAFFLRRYRHQSAWTFCWRVALEGLLASVLVGVPLMALGASKRDDPVSLGPWIVGAVVVIPWLETLVYQSLPIGICRRLGLGVGTQVIVSTSLFFAAHLSLGLTSGIAAGLVGGFYLAFTYIRWRRRSWWTAVWVTSLSHAIGNALVSLVVVLSLVTTKLDHWIIRLWPG